MVTDGVNVLSVRSRTTRSSKGKASPLLSLLYLVIQSYIFFALLSSSSPSHVLPLHSPHHQLLSDPDVNTQQLTEQLRQLGLYAADTTGDGNCLFRALSDQLYGTESRHHQLRKDICDWIQSHSLRYAPFVDDERGLDVHLSLMRQPGTFPPTILCSILSLLPVILSHIWWSSRTFRICTHEEVQCQGHPTRSCLSHRVGRWLGRRRCSEGNSRLVVFFVGHHPGRAGTHC